MSFLNRLRALGWFLVSAAWFLFSDLVAYRAASGLSSGRWEDWQEPLYRLCLLFLLILGYWIMSRLGQRHMDAAKATSLIVRPGWRREFALGAALGWAGVVACVLPAALIGGLVVTVFSNTHQLYLAALQLIALAAGTLALEVAFRGYPFQRLIEAMGPALGTFFMAVIFAIWRTHASQTTTASVLVSFFLGWVLALAVLRTRALWVGWGFHFAWLAVMGMLFGLPVAGSMSYSPVLVTNTVGPAWITGDGQGPEGSAFAVLVSFLLLFAILRLTNDLKYKYAFSEVVPGGIPVDIDAAARRQHEAATKETAPQQPSLVQILPAEPPFAPPNPSANTMTPPDPIDPPALHASSEPLTPPHEEKPRSAGEQG